MDTYSLSITLGSGNIRHNYSIEKRIYLPNVDKSRVNDNIVLKHESIQDAYHSLFDDAINDYNSKQKRNDRKIKNYYRKISKSKKEKTFYELIIQVGNYEKHPDKELSNKIYSDFVNEFQKKYPNLYVFGAYIHNDEATPHLHLDIIPYGTYNRSLTKRNSLSKALTEMNFTYKSKDNRLRGSYDLFHESVFSDFKQICLDYEIERQNMFNTEKHQPNVALFKEKEKLKSEIADLQKSKDILINSPLTELECDPIVSNAKKEFHEVFSDLSKEIKQSEYDIVNDLDLHIKQSPLKAKYIMLPIEEWNKIVINYSHLKQQLNNFKDKYIVQFNEYFKMFKTICNAPSQYRIKNFIKLKNDIDEKENIILNLSKKIQEIDSHLKFYKGWYEQTLTFMSSMKLSQKETILDRFTRIQQYPSRIIKQITQDLKFLQKHEKNRDLTR